MREKKAIIIFIKNPVLGKVKTRLAATIGNKKALKVYHYLLQNVRETVEEIESADKLIFYNSYIPTKDEWNKDDYDKYVQEGSDLGEKMFNAFKEAFSEDYTKVLLIVPDCPKLRASTLESAFKRLETSDVVLGPTEDGGYYLLGMKKLYKSIFKGKQFSTGSVFNETIKDLQDQGLKHFVYPKLKDIDHEEDLTERIRKQLEV